MHSLFESQAARRPDAPALISGSEAITYAELNARANQLAHFLKARGVAQGALIAIYLPRGCDAVVGMLAILKAGACYLPVDIADPSRRVHEILGDAQAEMVLTSARLLRRLDGAPCPVIALEHMQSELTELSRDNLPPSVQADGRCYVMYTSGSTGGPKGVVIRHRSVANLICRTDFLQLDASRVLLLLAPLCFDASTFELWGALLHGARLVIAPDGAPDPQHLLQLIETHHICTMWLTAGLFHTLVDVCPRLFGRLDQLIVGGDVLSTHHVRKVDRLLPARARLVNGYGPTEATTFTCCYEIPRPVSDEVQSIPIGRPIAGVRVHVVDEHLQPVSECASGELCIAGEGLAAGYLHAPQLTAQKFVQALFCDPPEQLVYRTGDRARWRADGQLEFQGRLDSQVKIRGQRVEPAEIEQALQQHQSISSCCVSVQPDQRGGRTIAAYFVADGDETPTSSELRAHLRMLLPEYMLPSEFSRIWELPLTANGKIDRDHFQKVPAKTRAKSAADAHRAADESALAAVWADVLGVSSVGRNDHFVFDLAGNSLLALQLIDRVNCRFGVHLTLPDLLKTPTVASMSARVIERSRRNRARVNYLSHVRTGRHVTPVVCVGFANALPLLEGALPNEVPIWWLKLEGLHAAPFRMRSISEIARSYHAELTQAPASELILLGHSFCGLIALEVARLLRQSGRQVKTLLLEPPPPDVFDDDDCSELLTADEPPVRAPIATQERQFGWAALQHVQDRLQHRFRKYFLRPYLRMRVCLGLELPLRHRSWWYYYPEMKKLIESFSIDRESGPFCLAGQPSYLEDYLPQWQAAVEAPIEVCRLAAATQHTDLMRAAVATDWLTVVRGWVTETASHRQNADAA